MAQDMIAVLDTLNLSGSIGSQATLAASVLSALLHIDQEAALHFSTTRTAKGTSLATFFSSFVLVVGASTWPLFLVILRGRHLLRRGGSYGGEGK